MSKLRDFFTALSALNDWQEEANRALTASAQNNCSPKAYKPQVQQTNRRTPSTEPVVIKRDALVLDLAAYREKKAVSA